MAASSAMQFQIRVTLDRFKFHEAGLRQLLTGPIARDLTRRAIRVTNAAKRNATDRPGPRVRTGLLRGSITWRLGQDARGMYADIGTAVFYGPFVELGTSRASAYPFLRPALQAAR